MGPASLYCRGLGGECEDGYGTLRGESGSTCDITILLITRNTCLGERCARSSGA